VNREDTIWISVSRFLARESLLLDTKDWDAWLDLYQTTAEYWVPAWTDAGELTSDPKTQVSLVYYANRSGLEDRVYRLRSGKSAAGNLEARTSHLSHLVDVVAVDETVNARANWQVNALLDGEAVNFFGWAEYELVVFGNSWKIKRKKTALLNDRPDTVLDFYLI
jgi:3-phenylpropionate/cinnamic acid dioxygenase small subunit